MGAMMDGPTAASLLAAWRTGERADPSGAATSAPLLVVDVSECRQPLDLRPPPGLPLVILAVATVGGRPLPPTPDGADVLLTDAPDAPSPWVSLPGHLGGGVNRLSEAVAACPLAASQLAQLLRLRPCLDVTGAVVVESLAYGVLQAGPEHTRWLAGMPVRRPGAPGRSVRVERAGSTLTVVLDRPRRRNAYSAEMRNELVEAFQLASADRTVEVVHLRGSGACFSSGGDLSEFGALADPATAHAVRTTRNAGLWIDAVAQETVAHVHGACFGAGIELPAFAVAVHVTADATFTLPEVGMGLIPGAGGTASIAARIGCPRLAWMALSGLPVNARTALSWGLIDRIVS